ncbi:oligoendopeptidase F [Erysipelothrix inopinata]|uniref:Oligopeptidase F n=1 Tax=Erysipelothrix inopinata TaxID=225084 RepID=A0A7G9RWC8_9FIRM|nr:oligoendopeptidase F [Erysipelothrix inopinata]QNN59903.1 oligoendopeptidase F [Erysipelothrix inopinata]
MKLRNEVDKALTWDLSSLYENNTEYEKALSECIDTISSFNKKYQGTLVTPEAINKALDEYRTILEMITRLATYNSLNVSSDQTDEATMQRMGTFQIKIGEAQNKLTFLNVEIKKNPESVLREAQNLSNENKLYLEDLIREIPHDLDESVEDALSQLSNVLNAPYNTYNRSKLADLKFDNFEVDGQEYANSFVAFENEWEYEPNHAVRRAAYDSFYTQLGNYQHTFAAIYQTKVQTEKTLATLKGFDSVIDYLLFDQKVSRDMYDRQIDLITKEFAPHMRRYARHLKDVHNLDTMTFSDLKIPVDPDFEPSITPEKSREYLLDGLSILGEDYLEMINTAFDDRWIDFPQNVGKSTGAFCSSPYNVHPYVLISWTERMREVFVLAHELGHAGHFYLAGQNQNIFDTRASLYFIEAPSTMNELIVANDLLNKANDDRFRRWVIASMISRTYYHNFVTHLLEAAYQREVYNRVDQGLPLSANVLNTIMKDVYTDFWGEDVEIQDYVGLTWMRQPHYYMGLYPYTYSAGLTISTASYQKVKEDPSKIEDWKEVLKAGGTKTPLELAKMMDIDLSTDKPLLDTIQFLADLIDEMIALHDKI